MPSVNLILPAGEAVVTGKQITFSSPCSNDGLNSILINGIEYALVDACRKPIGDVPEVFVRGALVSIVIDESNKLAYVQNAANNRYGIPIKQSIVDGVATLSLNTKYRVYAEVKHEVEADYFDCTVQLGSNLKSIVNIATLPSIEVTDTHREYFDIKILSVSRTTGDSTEDTVIYEIDGVRNQYSYPVVVLSMPVPTALLVKGATSVYSCPENMTGGTFVTPDGDATPGEDGGYYVPAVTDNEDGTVTFTFSASKDEMATIDPITIELPKGVAGAHVTSVEEYWGDATRTTYRMTFSNDTHYDFDVYHGHDGADGGYYTPSVQTVTENTFKISFTASKSGMPAVGDVTITLPTAKDGDDGVGIASVVQTTTSTADGGENIITVTLTNGNKSTFAVKNGSKGNTGAAGEDGKDGTNGKDGANGADGVGIKSIAKTATSGLVDTYTITLTNNVTSTFTVTNGKNGTNGTNGKDGDPYTLTDTDLSAIVQAVIVELGGQPVAGYFNEDNNLVITSDLADGDYTLKLKKGDELYDLCSVTVKTTLNEHTITWIVDGETYTTTVKEGVVPTFDGSTDKAADAQYTYTFAGWDKTVVAATADATYTAVYNKTVNQYTVTWVVDGKETAETYKYGDTPDFKGSTAKAADDQYTYTFTGWNPAISAVTGNKTYTAQYSKTAIEVEPTTYTVTFKADGVTVAAVTYKEGAPSIEEPTVPAKDGYNGEWEEYTLDGNITVNAVYTAKAPKNFADPTSTDWKTGCRLTTWIDQTTEAGSLTDGVVTNYIDVESGDYIEVTGINFSDSNNRIAWDFGGNYGSIARASAISNTSFSGLSYTANSFKATVAAPNRTDGGKMQIRFSGVATNGSEGVVINIKRGDEWL